MWPVRRLVLVRNQGQIVYLAFYRRLLLLFKEDFGLVAFFCLRIVHLTDEGL
jgi:hypothetical protein